MALSTESITTSILDHVKTLQTQLVAATQKLVQSDSQNPPGDVTAAAEVAVALIKQAIPTSEVRTYETAPGITNVVATIRGASAGKRLVFSGHLDTYPIGEEAKWTVPPLGGVVSDNGKRLYGRGAADMKGGIAASIGAAAALAEYRDHWDGEIVIALAGDEETMGTLGSAYLLDHLDGVMCDAMVCGDAGSPLVVRVGEKGLMWIEVEVKGQAAHGAHVHRGVNAIDRLLEALAALKSLENIQPDLLQEVAEAIAAARPVSEPLGGDGEQDTLQRITVNIGTISGGVSPNLVPDSAHAAADIRLPMGITSEKLLAEVHKQLDPLPGVTFRVLRSYDASWTPPSEKIVQHAVSASRSIAGSEAVVNMRVGASDARLFRQRGIPTVVVGLTPYNMGGPDEYLAVGELCEVAQIHALTSFHFLQNLDP